MSNFATEPLVTVTDNGDTLTFTTTSFVEEGIQAP